MYSTLTFTTITILARVPFSFAHSYSNSLPSFLLLCLAIIIIILVPYGRWILEANQHHHPHAPPSPRHQQIYMAVEYCQWILALVEKFLFCCSVQFFCHVNFSYLHTSGSFRKKLKWHPHGKGKKFWISYFFCFVYSLSQFNIITAALTFFGEKFSVWILFN